MKKTTSAKRALAMSAPFLFIALAIVLLSVFVFLRFIKTNTIFTLLTNSPGALSGDPDSSYLVIDDLTKEKLRTNNEGMKISSDFPAIAIGEKWATLTIDSAGVYDIPVYHGDSEDLLMRGLGHNTNSRFPGQHGRIVIAGHVGISRFFQRLETMNIGDTVNINTIYGDYTYQVTQTVIFDENDFTWVLPLEEETEDQLVCYTCYPYRTTSVRTQRFAIICKKVSGGDWVSEG